jgi:protein SMG6
MLTSGCAPPLPEDWCMRGMEWVGRKVFERGYWKSGEERKAEMEVLSPVDECGEGTDGRIEDNDDDEGVEKQSAMKCELVRRWVRIVRCAASISDAAEGFKWVEGSREWRVEGVLREKVQEWGEEERKEREEEERGGGCYGH